VLRKGCFLVSLWRDAAYPKVRCPKNDELLRRVKSLKRWTVESDPINDLRNRSAQLAEGLRMRGQMRFNGLD
jgi:hypothetical protein